MTPSNDISSDRKAGVDARGFKIESNRDSASETPRPRIVQLYVLPGLERKCELLLKNLTTDSARTLSRKMRTTLTLELIQRSCDFDCSCKCHGSRQHDHHWLRTGLVACLLNGYSAKPIFSVACDSKRCQRDTHKTTYAFPVWFWYRALSLSSYQPGPDFCLPVIPVLPTETEIFRAAFDVNKFPLRSLVDSIRHSLLHVNPTGHAIFDVSLE